MEVLLVCVIALVVLGPEKLPRLVRTLGQWLGKGRAMMKQVQQQLEPPQCCVAGAACCTKVKLSPIQGDQLLTGIC